VKRILNATKIWPFQTPQGLLIHAVYYHNITIFYWEGYGRDVKFIGVVNVNAALRILKRAFPLKSSQSRCSNSVVPKLFLSLRFS
jgi:hypothetical protein